MELTLRIQVKEIAQVATLFELVRAGVFDRESVVCNDEGTAYEVDLDDVHATYVFELLSDAIDGRMFESFVSWKLRHRDQLPLKLVPGRNAFELVDAAEG